MGKDIDEIFGKGYDSIKPENIFVYTYGALDIFVDQEENVTNGFENIHNIYNYYDTFGPNGVKNLIFYKAGNSVSKPEAKFGHTDMISFKAGETIWVFDFAEYDLSNYIRCIRAQ